MIFYGFLSGSADGSFGNRTDEAVKMAQLYVYEMLSERYQQKPTPTPTPTLRWITPTPTPTVTPRVTVDPESSETLRVFDAQPTATPTLRFAPEATPFVSDGIVTEQLLKELSSKEFECFKTVVKKDDKSDEVKRLQNRLITLGYMRTTTGKADGVFGVKTELALKYFQYKNGLQQTGIGDEKTQRILYSNRAAVSDTVVTKYKITVNTSKQRVYVYEWNGKSFNENPVKTFKCSSGKNDTPTPKGTYWNTGRISEWYYFKEFDCWAKYAWTIDGGILFHSVIYSARSESSVRSGTIRQLGSKASHGCVRLSVENAKWIFENCGAGTPVTVT